MDPLAASVRKARDAQALSSLQQALVSAALVRSESGGYGSGSDDLATRLQQKDPSKRFTTAPSSGPEQIQVIGGGAQPVLLVVRSPSDSYLGVWDDGGGSTLYYRGEQPPVFTIQRPAGVGWTLSPPQ